MKHKVLFVHNNYGVYSGEEAMLSKIMDLLSSHGHEVLLFSKDSKSLTGGAGKIKAFFSGIYSLKAQRELKKVVEEFRPDIVQIQNLFPLISPSILPLLKRMGIPVVMRLSNYRLICPNGLFLSHGKVCELCRNGREYYCAINNCEEALFKSIGYAVRNWVARRFKLYSENVTRFYSQTKFQKHILVQEGYPKEQIDVIPNMVSLQTKGKEWIDGDYIGYVGRMSSEKGIDIFLEAAKRFPDIQFKVAGNPQNYLSSNNVPGNVIVLGQLDTEELTDFYHNCRFIVMPSRCYEGFPGVILEAMNLSKPVVASRIGGIPEIVDDHQTGLLFTPGDVADLCGNIFSLWNDSAAIHRYGKAGNQKLLENFTPELYYSRLMNTYNQAKNRQTECNSIVEDH